MSAMKATDAEAAPGAKRRPCVLFVDDEPLILQGYRNQLRRRRGEWELEFFDSPDAALLRLERLEGAPIDLVVSDMRMPRLDGAQLLAEARRLRPSAARIVLSGQTDPDAAMRVLPFAHQFLAKPCDSRVLEDAVERSLRIVELVGDPSLRARISGLSALPSPPRTFQRLTELLASRVSTTRDVAALIEQDPAMAAKVIQLVNSAFFGLPRTISSIQEAITLIGLQTLRALVLCAGVFEQGTGDPDRRTESIRQHSLAVAAVARALAAPGTTGAEEYLAGLLHDVGMFLLGAETSGEQHPGHAVVGALVLASWGLPHTIVEAVLHHHEPRVATPEGVSLSAKLRIAEAIVASIAPMSSDGAQEDVGALLSGLAGVPSKETLAAIASRALEQAQ